MVNLLFSSAFQSLQMLCSVLCSRCNIAVAIAYKWKARFNIQTTWECQRLPMLKQRGHQNNPAVYERQLCACSWLYLQSACSQLNLGEVFLIVKASRRC